MERFDEWLHGLKMKIDHLETHLSVSDAADYLDQRFFRLPPVDIFTQ